MMGIRCSVFFFLLSDVCIFTSVLFFFITAAKAYREVSGVSRPELRASYRPADKGNHIPMYVGTETRVCHKACGSDLTL